MKFIIQGINMKLVQEFKDSIVVECNKCKKRITINRDSIYLESNRYAGDFKCECGNYAFNTEGEISPTFKSIQASKDTKDTKGKIGCITIIGGFIFALIVGISVNSTAFAVALVIIAFIFGWVMISSGQSGVHQKIQNRASEKKRMVKDKYQEIKRKSNIPLESKVINYKSGYADIIRSENYIWIRNNQLCFFPKENDMMEIDKVKIYRIPINKIEYYATRGEIVHENKITGGGGGGTSVGGAVVGGVIAGGAGAIIGSRKKIDPIKSELITHDKRETFINFFDDKDVKHSMFFDFKDYNILNELMPEKAFEIVNTIKTNTILNRLVNESNSSSITDQIRELAKLKDEGILTEEEFVEKKKFLLDKM